MTHDDDKKTHTGERRKDRRLAAEGTIRIRVGDQELLGITENVSTSGVLFVTEDCLRVTVELEEDGIIKRLSGRVVRTQRMKGGATGWAVELD
jgi:hypothetical protein